MGDNINELTQEQLQRLLALIEQSTIDDFDRSQLFNLPEEILQELEEPFSFELKAKLKKFGRDTLKYDGGRWTQSGAINRVFLSELRKQHVDATQPIHALYKGADRLRTAAKASTEIYSDFQHIIENGGSQEEMEIVLQQIKRLAVYTFATGKELDKDAKDSALKSLKLPENMQYLRETDDEDKDLAFAPELIQKIQQGCYEEAVVKSATSKQYGGFKRNDRGRGSFRGGQKRGSFFGRGRGRGFTPTNDNNNQHQSTTSHPN
ncbi:hypothetical protein V8B55DRAFT_1571058, partial [Mucor lusitanicus]|uniref:Uncharacterized protein n=1 Tax=Mucor lusitanicus CBS 277.49 TaxID=747725 RepID=A0A168J628_MUCCL|nr:hypothetical protein MUCCIDRAFT_85067 [Mucor lusitanicus CBS 277.49]